MIFVSYFDFVWIDVSCLLELIVIQYIFPSSVLIQAIDTILLETCPVLEFLSGVFYLFICFLLIVYNKKVY
jgi:hypothetical protein